MTKERRQRGSPVDSVAWLTAARDPAVIAALRSVFDDTAAAIAARGPACWASGRCCNFEAAGHRLYVTGLEAAYTLLNAREQMRVGGSSPSPGPPPVQGPGKTGGEAPIAQSGGQSRATSQWPDGNLSLSQIADARARGGCPFQQANLCGVHDIKPVACRVYFCDNSATTWQNDLAERMHERVRAIHERFGVPYLYAEWRGLLEMLC